MLTHTVASASLHPPSLLQLLDKVDASIRKQPTVRGNYEQILGRSLESLVNRAEELKTKWQVGAELRVLGWGLQRETELLVPGCV